jgi:hypothetical protein
MIEVYLDELPRYDKSQPIISARNSALYRVKLTRQHRKLCGGCDLAALTWYFLDAGSMKPSIDLRENLSVSL